MFSFLLSLIRKRQPILVRNKQLPSRVTLNLDRQISLEKNFLLIRWLCYHGGCGFPGLEYVTPPFVKVAREVELPIYVVMY